MTRYSVQRRDRIFVKGYRFFSLAKNVGKNTGKNISKKFQKKDIYLQNKDRKLFMT